MARKSFRFGTALALAATLSMVASPAMARDRWDRHRGGVDAGDVIAGVLVVGAIAALASAASKPKREPEVYREPYPDTRPVYRDDRYTEREYSDNYSNNGINDAVNTCVGQVERGDDRVASVDNASRTADGWQISGQLRAGDGFSCRLDNNGRIRAIDIGGGYDSGYYDEQQGDYYGSSYQDAPAGGQWDDDAYARARAAQNDRSQQSYDDADIDGDLAYGQ